MKDCDKGESISGYTEDHKIWEIIKQYSDKEIKNTGLAIDVYQESINSYWREYLVDYDFLTEKKFRNMGYYKLLLRIIQNKFQKKRLVIYALSHNNKSIKAIEGSGFKLVNKMKKY